jgi:hypothetical protein
MIQTRIAICVLLSVSIIGSAAFAAEETSQLKIIRPVSTRLKISKPKKTLPVPTNYQPVSPNAGNNIQALDNSSTVTNPTGLAPK